MIKLEIPGFKKLQLSHLVLDYNGTLAVDGELINGIRERLIKLAENIQIHILTADTFGMVQEKVIGIPCRLSILQAEDQDIEKLNYIDELGANEIVCIGNGRNDRLMLKKAQLGIAVMQQEGAAVEVLMAADIVLPDIITALDLLSNPLRLKATLRS